MEPKVEKWVYPNRTHVGHSWRVTNVCSLTITSKLGPCGIVMSWARNTAPHCHLQQFEFFQEFSEEETWNSLFLDFTVGKTFKEILWKPNIINFP